MGYGKAERRDLPAIRPSVLCPGDAPDITVTTALQNRSILQYIRDYHGEKDLKILLRNWRYLGRWNGRKKC